MKDAQWCVACIFAFSSIYEILCDPNIDSHDMLIC